MADKIRKKTFDVPLTFGDSIRHIKGVTKYTTCGDVIKMVLRKLDRSTRRGNGASEVYGIYESSRGVERLLPTKSRIMKIIRSWEVCEQYELVFHKVNPAFTMSKTKQTKHRKLKHRRPDVRSRQDDNCANVGRYSRSNDFIKDHQQNKKLDCNMDITFEASVNQNNMEEKLTVYGSEEVGHYNMLSPAASMCEISRNVTGQSNDDTLVYNSSTIIAEFDANNRAEFDVKSAVRNIHDRVSCLKSSLEKQMPVAESSPKISKRQGAYIPFKHIDKLTCDNVTLLNQRTVKQALLQRYFAGYVTYGSPANNFRDSRFRERGDGAEAVNIIQMPSNYGHGAPFRHNEQKRSTTLVLDASESDSGNESDVTSFDTAFIGDDDQTFATNNAKHVGKLVNYSLSKDDSILSDLSDISTCNEHGQNVSNLSGIVKHAFNDHWTGRQAHELSRKFQEKTI